MNITYDYYRVFYYVARYQSFTKAANALMSSQPNVTKFIRNLEAQLHCQLFDRTNRQVRLTEAGERLYAHVQIAFEHLAQAEEELTADNIDQHGTISIGTSETALHGALLPILRTFKAAHPLVHCCVNNDTTQNTVQALADGQVDLALVSSPVIIQGDIKRTTLCTYHELLTCGRHYAHLKDRAYSLTELAQYPWIDLRRDTQTHALHSQLFLKEQLIFRPDVEVTTASELLPMLLHQLGIGFIPDFFAADALASGELLHIHLKTEWPVRCIYLLENTQRPAGRWAQTLKQLLLNEH